MPLLGSRAKVPLAAEDIQARIHETRVIAGWLIAAWVAAVVVFGISIKVQYEPPRRDLSGSGYDSTYGHSAWQ
jgi:hypothetical protein